MPCPPRESSGRRAETPGITRGARRRTRLRRGFFLGRAGSRSPFPATGRQAAVVGAAPRPSSNRPAGHTTPHTTQCKHPGHQGARKAGLRAPRARFITCHQKRPPAGRARETARNTFLTEMRLKHQGIECLDTALAACRGTSGASGAPLK
jgi:hypothetical protein